MENEINAFFRHPTELKGDGNSYSILLVLRRDILTCFGINPNTCEEILMTDNNGNTDITFRALFPGVMAIMAGIDLLSKFYLTESGSSRKRFKKFVEVYIDKDNSEEIYQLRNSLLHSFGLISEDLKGKVYRFILSRNYNSLVSKNPYDFIPEDHYVVNIDILHQKFEMAIALYKKDMEGNDVLRNNFIESYKKYGTMTTLAYKAKK